MNARFCWLIIAAASLALAPDPLQAGKGEKGDKGAAAFNIKGTYIEGCSCHVSCGCSITGPQSGCAGLNIIDVTSGTYNGVDLSGGKIAIGTVPGDWVRVFAEGKTPEQQTALEAFGSKAFTAFGKIESVAAAKIEIKGKDGAYDVLVNGGKTMKLTTKALMGADKKTPVVHSNMGNPLTNLVFQGQAVSGSFSDGDRSFKLKDSNAYFNNKVAANGKM